MHLYWLQVVGMKGTEWKLRILTFMSWQACMVMHVFYSYLGNLWTTVFINHLPSAPKVRRIPDV